MVIVRVKRVTIVRLITIRETPMRLFVYFLLDPRAFTSNKQVGLENKRAKSMRDGKIYQFFQSKPPILAGFGASLVLSTIVLPGN